MNTGVRIAGTGGRADSATTARRENSLENIEKACRIPLFLSAPTDRESQLGRSPGAHSASRILKALEQAINRISRRDRTQMSSSTRNSHSKTPLLRSSTSIRSPTEGAGAASS